MHPGDLAGHPGTSRGSSWGVLGRSWAVLGRSWGDIFTSPTSERFLITCLIDFGRQKGAKREAFWEPRWVKNRSKNGVENEDEKKTLLGGSWVDFGTFWEGGGGSFLLIFHLFLYDFRESSVFEKDKRPRAISTRFGPLKVPK